MKTYYIQYHCGHTTRFTTVKSSSFRDAINDFAEEFSSRFITPEARDFKIAINDDPRSKLRGFKLPKR